MSIWKVTYGGVTKEPSAWGISRLARERKSTATGLVTFALDGMAVDSAGLPFPCLVGTMPANQLPQVSLTRAGVPWFSGIVTKAKGKAKPNAESVDYEIADAWWFLEKTIFQQQWVQVSGSGEGLVTSTTAKSNVILGQAVNGIKINAGQVLREVLIYAQYAYQMLPFPDRVNVHNLPDAPPTPAPFIIGTISPANMVPFVQVRNRSCADIIRLILKWCPSCVSWMDYSTTPMTLNISPRSALPAKAFPVFGTSLAANGYKVNGFDPVARHDLRPPVVVLKFEEYNTINGTTYDDTTDDVYPPAPAAPAGYAALLPPPPVGTSEADWVAANWAKAWASQPMGLVQTVDLTGGHLTEQSANIKAVARPVSPGDSVALSWALSKCPALLAKKGIPYVGEEAGQPLYDTANMTVALVSTTIDPNDPLNDPEQNPNNITISNEGNDCPQLVNELLTSGWSTWLQNDPNDLDCAKVRIEVQLKYTGTDAATAGLFTQDPTNAANVLPDGTGVYRIFYTCKVTNADTGTYSQITSVQGSEPVPTGIAQQLYTEYFPLYWEADMTLIEYECSDRLPPGSVFNPTDGADPAWATMNALVLEVREDIDHGVTAVKLGHPVLLDGQELEELFRLSYGFIPSYQLDQRTSGELSTNKVIGDEHHADTHVVLPGTPATEMGAFAVTTSTTTGGAATAKVNIGLLYTDASKSVLIPITGLNADIAVLDNDFVWIEGTLDPATGKVTACKVNSNGAGGGWAPTTDIQIGGTPSWLNYQYGSSGVYPDVQQVNFRLLLATLTPNTSGGAPKVSQALETNLYMVTYTAFDATGRAFPAIYPVGV